VLLDRQSVDDAEVLVLRGHVADADAASLRTAVDDALGAGGRGVVIDLTDAEAVTAAAAEALTDVAASAGSRPRPAIAVCGAPSSLRSRLALRVAVHDDRQHALDHLGRTADGAVRREVGVEHGPLGPRQARQAVQSWAADIGLGRNLDDLLLLVSELVTNAVRYGSPPVRVEVTADDRTVTLGVEDGTAERPVGRQASDDAEGGRGLLLLSLLSTDHGVRSEPPGKVVWASLSR
jgi:anti-anti-sigma regulatory factor